MIPGGLVNYLVTITRPVVGSNAAGDTGIPTGAYESTGQANVRCVAEQVSGGVDAEQARIPRRNSWRVIVDGCVDARPLDRVELTDCGTVVVVADVVAAARFTVPARVAHVELTCRETTG